MKNVYIVTSGKYSSYHICGVFSSTEMAEGFINLAGDDEMEIEIWEMNPFTQEIRNGMNVWGVYIKRNGDITSIWQQTNTDEIYSNKTYNIFHDKSTMYLTCLAKSKEHAIKIAGETRARAIYENEWDIEEEEE